MKPPSSSSHPSFLELDRHALGVGRPDTPAHVASCETCRARLGQADPAPSVPAWALRLDARPRARFAWASSPRLRPLGWGVTAFACALVLWIATGHLRTRATGIGADTDTYVGTKGGPDIWLYVKRGERVELWNGSDPVHPGDLLRLKVQPDRYRHVSVFGGNKAPNAYTRLYDAAVAADHRRPCRSRGRSTRSPATKRC